MAEKISFEKLENEPAAAFQHFVIYRDLGRRRSMRWAYQRYLDQQAAAGRPLRRNANPAGPKNVPGSWVQESKVYQWRTRVAAYELDRVIKAQQTQQTGYKRNNFQGLMKRVHGG